MAQFPRRALHFCLKIGNRKSEVDFLRNDLGMTVLRHEEFEGGCKATCNGPYQGNWSKTMIGYGSEDVNFVLELTYNYGISSYVNGNEYLGITLQLPEGAKSLEKLKGLALEDGDGSKTLKSPSGHPFFLNISDGTSGSKFTHVRLACSNLAASTTFWKDVLGMKQYDAGDNSDESEFGFLDDPTRLVLKEIKGPINRGTGFGRFAFSAKEAELPVIEKLVKEKGYTVLTSLVSLDTPGKATVKVVILADPDGHEVAFVGEEGCMELSQIDPKADDLLNASIAKDMIQEKKYELL